MKWLLLPFSYLFATGVWLRNLLFNARIYKSVEFDIPVIVVGNLRVGGTGKTPHTEWLIQQLETKYRVGVLSRGYGRRTKGFRWVELNDTAVSSGDEPIQIKTKFPGVAVAVCEDRVSGIPEMLSEKELDVIILDDAFQHRYIKPTLSIVVSAIDKPFFKDEYLPAGRLREKGGALKRAEVFIYTKCIDVDNDKKKILTEKVKRYNGNIEVFFSGYRYGMPVDLKTGKETGINSKDVVVITGIADSSSFIKHIGSSYNIVKHFNYADHFNYNSYDVKQWKKYIGDKAFPIITTEKDAVRIQALMGIAEGLQMFYLTIQVEILDSKKEEMLQLLSKKLDIYQV